MIRCCPLHVGNFPGQQDVRPVAQQGGGERESKVYNPEKMTPYEFDGCGLLPEQAERPFVRQACQMGS